MRLAVVGTICLLCIPFTVAIAAEEGCRNIKLQDYEPNTVVVRFDKDDERHIDFTLSQMVPLFHDGCKGEASAQAKRFFRAYFSFSGQFGFYALGDRDSMPVIGKRYNPKLFFRHWLDDKGGYVDLGFAHESNGQSIGSEALYLQKQAEIVARGDRAEFANDYLSRGWDYLDLMFKYNIRNQRFRTSFIYINLKYFLADSPLQGQAEDYYSWETNDGKERSEVDGIHFLIKSSSIKLAKAHGMKVAFLYTTGYKKAFQNHTAKLEFTYRYRNWPPFLLWVANGYNSNLTDYYRDVFSVGLGVELRNFLGDY